MLQEVVVIGKLMFGPSSCRNSNAHSVAVNLMISGHTNPITSQSTCSNVNTRKAQLVTCNVVVGLVLCKSSEGSRVVLSDSCVEGYFVKHLDQFIVFTGIAVKTHLGRYGLVL